MRHARYARRDESFGLISQVKPKNVSDTRYMRLCIWVALSRSVSRIRSREAHSNGSRYTCVTLNLRLGLCVEFSRSECTGVCSRSNQSR